MSGCMCKFCKAKLYSETGLRSGILYCFVLFMVSFAKAKRNRYGNQVKVVMVVCASGKIQSLQEASDTAILSIQRCTVDVNCSQVVWQSIRHGRSTTATNEPRSRDRLWLSGKFGRGSESRCLHYNGLT